MIAKVSSEVDDGGGAEKAKAEEQRSPNVPTGPVTEEAEEEQQCGQECGDQAMSASTERAKDVATIELPGREKI